MSDPEHRLADGSLAKGNTASKGHWFNRGPGRKPQSTIPIKNALITLLDESLDYIRAVANDPSEPIARRIAAKRLLLADRLEDRRSDVAFDQVADRAEGKPKQTQDVSVRSNLSPEQLLEQLRHDIGLSPTPVSTQEISDEEFALDSPPPPESGV